MLIFVWLERILANQNNILFVTVPAGASVVDILESFHEESNVDGIKVEEVMDEQPGTAVEIKEEIIVATDDISYYQCNSCSSTFTTVDRLHDHETIHQGE